MNKGYITLYSKGGFEMSFKDDLNNFLQRKERRKEVKPEPIPGTRKSFGVGKHCRICKSKPNLFDPKAKNGPVKHYTKEEIMAYENDLREKGLLR